MAYSVEQSIRTYPCFSHGAPREETLVNARRSAQISGLRRFPEELGAGGVLLLSSLGVLFIHDVDDDDEHGVQQRLAPPSSLAKLKCGSSHRTCCAYCRTESIEQHPPSLESENDKINEGTYTEYLL